MGMCIYFHIFMECFLKKQIVESICMRYIGKNSFLLLLDSFVAFATNESHILYTIDFVRRI